MNDILSHDGLFFWAFVDRDLPAPFAALDQLDKDAPLAQAIATPNLVLSHLIPILYKPSITGSTPQDAAVVIATTIRRVGRIGGG